MVLGDTGVMQSNERGPLVVTVDEVGTETGTADRLDAHRAPGTLHSAISLQVVSDDESWLVQRRADHKPVFGGRWANTCCTHPLPGEEPADTALRRAREELGLVLADLVCAGTFVYRAVDETSGLVEHEFDTVFLARVAGRPEVRPDADEIAEVVWTDRPADLAGGDDAAPWMAAVVAMVAELL